MGEQVAAGLKLPRNQSKYTYIGYAKKDGLIAQLVRAHA